MNSLQQYLEALDETALIPIITEYSSDPLTFQADAQDYIDMTCPQLKNFIRALVIIFGSSAVIGATTMIEFMRRCELARNKTSAWLDEKMSSMDDTYLLRCGSDFADEPSEFLDKCQKLVDEHSPALKEFFRWFAGQLTVESTLAAVAMLELIRRKDTVIQ